MTEFFNNAADAMQAAYELSQLLRRPVWRHITHDKHGKPLWYISLNRTPQNALQELAA